MNNSVPFVSIIIPAYRDWIRLSLCLDSLTKQSWPQDQFEVIVVNNKPDDRAPEGFQLAENTVLIDETKSGSYAARNAALKISRGSIVGFTDSDCIVDKDWISNAVEIFENHPEIARIGGAINIFFKGNMPTVVELHDKIFAFPQEAYVKSGNAVTGNMFSRKMVFDRIGLFDDTLLSGGDHQWGMLAQQNGFPIIYGPNVQVNHPARDSLKELVIKEKRIGLGQANFKDANRLSSWAAFKQTLDLCKPRRWEIKIIFNKGKRYGLVSKIAVVAIRHYIKITGDLTRIHHLTKRTEKVSI